MTHSNPYIQYISHYVQYVMHSLELRNHKFIIFVDKFLWITEVQGTIYLIVVWRKRPMKLKLDWPFLKLIGQNHSLCKVDKLLQDSENK